MDDVEFIRVGQSQNLAPDPGFELGTGWSAIPTAGFPGTSLWRGGWGTGTPRSGSYAFALSNHSYGTLQTDPIAVLPGATYTLSAWVRGKLNAQASGGGWTLKLLAYDRQGALISSYTVASGGGGSLTITAMRHGLQQRSGTVTLPGNATTVRAELFDTMTDGWVAMDDVSITGPTVTKYYYLGSQRVAMRQGGVLTYLHGDHGRAQHGLQRLPALRSGQVLAYG